VLFSALNASPIWLIGLVSLLPALRSPPGPYLPRAPADAGPFPAFVTTLPKVLW